MPTILEAAILGMIQGIAEFLPISSTAHLILASDLMGLAQTPFLKSFEIIIQLGSILAVTALYWRSLLDVEVLKRLAVAFVPTGAVGLILYKIVKQYLMGSTSVVLWSLALGGAFLIVFERLHREKPDAREEIRAIPYRHCLALGLFQSLAMIPGVSRSAATIVGGLLLGLRRQTIVEFSFLLAVPTMFAATGLDIIKNAGEFSGSGISTLAVGFTAAFVMAIVGIKSLLSYIRRRSFVPFGIYRIALVALFLI